MLEILFLVKICLLNIFLVEGLEMDLCKIIVGIFALGIILDYVLREKERYPIYKFFYSSLKRIYEVLGKTPINQWKLLLVNSFINFFNFTFLFLSWLLRKFLLNFNLKIEEKPEEKKVMLTEVYSFSARKEKITFAEAGPLTGILVLAGTLILLFTFIRSFPDMIPILKCEKMLFLIIVELIPVILLVFVMVGSAAIIAITMANNIREEKLIGILILLTAITSFIVPFKYFFVLLIYVSLIISAIALIRNRPIIRFISISCILSFVFSSIFILFINFLPHNSLNNFWFQEANDIIRLTKIGNWLLIINFPFDLATIYITYLLFNNFIIKKVKSGKKSWPILPLAVIDIFVSYILSIFLYTTLKIIENSWVPILHPWNYKYLLSNVSCILGFMLNIFKNIPGCHIYLIQSIEWFISITPYIWYSLIHLQFDKGLSLFLDVHLLPILLTTFIPVTLYMSVLLFLVFSGIIIQLTERIIENFTKIINLEKPEGLFSKLATFINAWIAIINFIIPTLNWILLRIAIFFNSCI